MIKTSTRPPNPSHNERATNNEPADLSEEELLFYTSIKPDLNKIKLKPDPDSVRKILDYSRSI